MKVFEVLAALPHDIIWTLIQEDYNSDRIGTTVGTIQYRQLCPCHASSEIIDALYQNAVSIDLIENVIFYTTEDINK